MPQTHLQRIHPLTTVPASHRYETLPATEPPTMPPADLRQKPRKSVGGPQFLPGTSDRNPAKVSEIPSFSESTEKVIIGLFI